MNYEARLETLVSKMRGLFKGTVGNNYFLIEDVKIPLMNYSQLPFEAKEYFKALDAEYLANQESAHNLPEYSDRSMSLFRAPFMSEFLDIGSDKAYTLSPETNFEPFVGISIMRHKNNSGYSGQIIEIKGIPQYLVMRSIFNSAVHPERWVRFPIRTTNIQITE